MLVFDSSWFSTQAGSTLAGFRLWTGTDSRQPITMHFYDAGDLLSHLQRPIPPK